MDQHARLALLEEQETIIEDSISEGVPAFRRMGEALKVIRDGKLWRGTPSRSGGAYTRWDAYLRERWGFTPSYASQLISGALVARLLTAVNAPLSHAAARELAAVRRDGGDDAARRVAETAGPGASAPAIRAAARRLSVRRANAQRRRAFGRFRFPGEIANMLVTLTFDVMKSRPRLVEAGAEEWVNLKSAVRDLLKEIRSARKAWRENRADRVDLEDITVPGPVTDEPPADTAVLPA